ncbi:MAG: serine hydrolase domain-containing protein [Pseudomonadota bacterium]|nr:serine hydrolase domain-containing protein [Pseudomonadota bacterium]
MNQVQPRRSFARRLLRHLVRFVLTSAVLLGPNIVFYGRWDFPDETLPVVPSGRDDRVALPGLPARLSDDLLASLRANREHGGLPSMSAAIAFDGKLQWAAATGFADIENQRPATVQSRYRTGSVAKSITAVALMRLMDAGKVTLDAPISQYVPDLPLHLLTLTAELLGSHRAGIRHYTIIPQWWMGWHENYSTHNYPSVADGLTLFVDDALRFEPGTGFRYSTFGYSLLARLMEGASGQAFAQLLDVTVFQPAGMTATAVDTPSAAPERVAFYQAEGGRYTPSYPINSSYKIAGGGLISTPSDLVRLGALLLGDGFVSAAGKKAMWTPLALADGSMNPENYAIGWRVDTSTRMLGDTNPVQIFHHGGAQQGAAAFIMLVPKYGIAVAAMSNSGSRSARVEVQEATYALVRRVVQERTGKLHAPEAGE